MQHLKYRSDIDGLRAIAVLIVIVYHAFPTVTPGGFIGVDVFFVISGFLISTIIFESLKNDSFSFIDFYCRRIRRIFPSLTIVLIVVLFLGWFLFIPEDYEKLGKHTFGGAFFLSNLVSLLEFGYFDTAAEFKPLLHLWSLGIEEQFYIVWPIILWSAWRFRIWSPLLIVLGICASFSLNVYKSGFDTTFAFFSPKTRIWQLLLGAGLSYVALQGQFLFTKFRYPALKHAISITGLVMILGGSMLINRSLHYPGSWALIPSLGALCIIGAGPTAWVNKHLLSRKLFIGIGLISYPLYLWHWPLLAIANITAEKSPSIYLRCAIVLLSFGLAYLTYRLIELPIRRSHQSRLTALLLLISISAIGLLGLLTFKAGGLVGQTTKPKLVNASALESCAHDLKNHKLCILGNPHSKETLLVYGDSHAEHLATALTETFGQKYKIIFAYYPSCFWGERLNLGRKAGDDCDLLVNEVKSLKGTKISAIIRSQLWHGYGVTNEKYISDAIMDAITAFDLKPEKVIIAGTTASVDIRCEKWNYYFGDARYRKTCHSDVESKEALENFIKVTEDLSVPSFVKFVYPYKKLCDENGCEAIKDGIQYYSDSNHLTKDGARLIMPDIADILNQ